MESRLKNWAWYVSYGVIGPVVENTCRSFEKNYVPELGNLYAESEPHYEPDHVDGELIEQAIKGLPLELRRTLKMRYVSHPYASSGQLAHALRVSPARLEVDLENAKKRLQHELDKKTKSNKFADMLKMQNPKND